MSNPKSSREVGDRYDASEKLREDEDIKLIILGCRTKGWDFSVGITFDFTGRAGRNWSF